MNWKEEDMNVDRFYDRLMACIILTGGGHLDRENLERLPLRQLVDMCFANGVDLSVSLREEQ